MPLRDPVQVALARLYAERAAMIRRLLGDEAVRAYDELDYYGQAELDEYLDRMVPLSLAAQRAMATTLAGYLTLASDEQPDEPWELEDVTGDAVRPDGLRHGWSIPWYHMWGLLGAGVAVAVAAKETRELYRTQAVTDLSFAQSATMAALGDRLSSIVGYRRVLSGAGCEFCTEAADELYASDDLMPVHPGCNCAVAPVFADSDPGSGLNDETLEEVDA